MICIQPTTKMNLNHLFASHISDKMISAKVICETREYQTLRQAMHYAEYLDASDIMISYGCMHQFTKAIQCFHKQH